jgi:hypothetical protein
MRSFMLLLGVCATAAAPSAQVQDPLAATRAACTADALKFCARVQPGGGRIVACLKEHKDSLSDRCKPAAAPTAALKLVIGRERFVQRAVVDTQ